MTDRDRFVASAVLMMKDYFGVSLSEAEMSKLIRGREVFKREWKHGYSDVSPYMDTLVREHLADAVAMKYVGRYWPSYCEGKEVYEAFWADLTAKLAARG